MFFVLFFCFFNLEKGEDWEKERERNINVREKYQLVVSCTHPDWGLTTQACALAGNFALWYNAQTTEKHCPGGAGTILDNEVSDDGSDPARCSQNQAGAGPTRDACFPVHSLPQQNCRWSE